MQAALIFADYSTNSDYVFTYRGKNLDCMNNTASQDGRKRAAQKYKKRFDKKAHWGFEHLRIYDLKHTFGRRLRTAGVGEETRKVLLGNMLGTHELLRAKSAG